MKKFTVLLCLLISSTVRADNPLPRVTCNGIFYGYPSTLNFQGATCTGIGGVNAVNVAPVAGPPGPTGATGATGATGPAGADLSAEPLITKIASANLSNEFALGSLASGLLLNTITTGVPAIYPGTSCSADQYMTALDASGARTCSQVTTAQLSGTVANAQLASTYSGVGGCAAGRFASTLNGNAAPTCTQVAYADVSGTPTIPADISAASYITKVAEASLSNEFALGSLATGLLKNTATTGVPTIAASGTDYAPATSGSVILLGNGAGGFSNYGGASSCTNQFFTGLSSAGASTCSTATLASAQFANQGTTTTLLHGNAAGNPSWAGVSLTADASANQGTTTTVLHGNASGQPSFGAVSLTADVSGILPLANGGTNKNNTAANGAVAYSDASGVLLSAVGTSGQGLYSAGAAAPTWSDAQKLVRLTSDYTNATTSMTNTALTWTSPAVVSRSGFTCKVMVKSSATTLGAQFDVNVSVAPTTITYWVQWISAAGTPPSTIGTWNHVTATASATAIGPTAGLTTYTIGTVEGVIVHTSSAATVTIRAKATSAGTVTVGSGSFCTYYVL